MIRSLKVGNRSRPMLLTPDTTIVRRPGFPAYWLGHSMTAGLILLCDCVEALIYGQGLERVKLEVSRRIVNLPIEQTLAIYPDQLVAGSGRQIFLSDSESGRLFSVSLKDGQLNRLDIKAPFSDFVVGKQETFWLLDSSSRSVSAYRRRDGKRVRTFQCSPASLAIGILDDGTLVIHAGSGPHLFELFTPEGALIKTFGEPQPASSEAERFFLNFGKMSVAGQNIYFCFQNPYEIRCYNSTGALEWTHTLPLSVPPPKIRVSGTTTSVNMYFSCLAIAADNRGNVFVLESGELNVRAYAKGSGKLDVVSRAGLRRRYVLDNAYVSISFSKRGLLAMRNGKRLLIDLYSLAS